jgi:Fur family zinc uptake transcriptional regulator
MNRTCLHIVSERLMPARNRRTFRRSRDSKSKPTELVLSALRLIGRPAGAYELQARLSDVRHFAPTTIYRALERLIDDGLVHKIESLNAFIACRHSGQHERSAFAICDRCGSVVEICDQEIKHVVDACSRQSGFDVVDATIELHGSCSKCNSRGSA